MYFSALRSFLLFSLVMRMTQATNSYSNASHILQSVVTAMGGIHVLNNITAFSYEASTIYRSQTLTQSYGLSRSDQSVAAAGIQTMSFLELNGTLRERIDRSYVFNDYWIWAWPTLTPEMNYSVVVRDGDDGFACFNQGQNSFYAEDHEVALGYADSYLTDYLVHQAHQFALPWLIKQFAAAQSLRVSQVEDPLTGVVLPALEHPSFSLTLVVNNDLPYMVRSYEQHRIYGQSTSDIIFSNYSMFDSILLPQRIQTVYNTFNLLEDFFVDDITINQAWPGDFFEPKLLNTTPKAPKQSEEYPRSEVHEFFETALWGGPFPFNVSDVEVEYPVPGIEAIKSVYVGYADYVQLLVEFDEGFLITDAAPHRSKILLDWVAQTSRKNITYVVPSHHHRDHAGGVDDYVAAGAKIVVPTIARDYYAKVNGGKVEFETYAQDQSFVLNDGRVQFRAFWRGENPHAADWSYGVATAACPTDDTGVVIFNADVIDPGDLGSDFPTSNAVRWDAGYGRQWVFSAVEDGIPRSSLIVGAHGSSMLQNVSNAESLERVADITGVLYPDIRAGSWADKKHCR